MNNKKLVDLYNKNKFNLLIQRLSQKNIKNRSQLIFNFNLLACAQINIGDVEGAVRTYEKALKKIKGFNNSNIDYNIGFVPKNVAQADRLISKYVYKFKNEFISKYKNIDKFQDIVLSLRINPRVKGEYHSNLGQTLINVIKFIKLIINSKKSVTKLNELLYSNPKYNSYKAEKFLKKKQFTKFKSEITNILKYNKYNSRAHAVSSYALQKYNLKTADNFCKMPLNYVKKFNLIDSKDISNSFLKKIDHLLNKEIFCSDSPGSVYNGYKSIDNIFNTKNKLILKLKKIVLKKINEYFKIYRKNNTDDFIKKFPKDFFLKSWFIKIKKGGGIRYHIHNAWLSGVIYITIPRAKDYSGGGNIRFSLANWGFDKEIKFIREVKPMAGDMLLFPSCLPHAVTKFNQKKYRLCISFDLISA